MIIWSGRGILSILVLIASFAICFYILPDDIEDYAWVISLFLTAIFSWYFGNKWNNQYSIIVLDKKSGHKVKSKITHALFWIKMQYWGLIFSILGVMILAQSSIVASATSLVILLAVVALLYFKNKKKDYDEEGQIFVVHKDQITSEDILIVDNRIIESEEERIKHRQEKEDPKRFMPK